MKLSKVYVQFDLSVFDLGVTIDFRATYVEWLYVGLGPIGIGFRKWRYCK